MLLCASVCAGMGVLSSTVKPTNMHVHTLVHRDTHVCTHPSAESNRRDIYTGQLTGQRQARFHAVFVCVSIDCNDTIDAFVMRWP